MATTIEELSGILTRGEIKHAFDKDGDIYFGFQTENYTNPAGDKALGMHLRISNEGQIFSLTAHEAFLVKGSQHIDAFLKLCSILQMSGYLIQFEYVPFNGTVRPCIEIPLMDNKLTKGQLDFCIASMVKAMEDNYQSLKQALETGSLAGLPEEMLKAMPYDDFLKLSEKKGPAEQKKDIVHAENLDSILFGPEREDSKIVAQK